METYKPTLHGALALRHERHAYRRGQFKGDAPMGARYKSHYRIIKHSDHIAVRFHNTDIVQAYPDGRIRIHCSGWVDSPTTKQHLNEVLQSMPRTRISVWSTKLNSVSQQILYVNGTSRYCYYDGIEFDGDGNPLTPLRPFSARRINKDEVAELNGEIAESGFKDAFRVLWSQAVMDDAYAKGAGVLHRWRHMRNRTEVVMAHNTDQWLPLIAWFAHDTEWQRDPITNSMRQVQVKHSHSKTWSKVMQWIKAGMFQIVDTEVVKM